MSDVSVYWKQFARVLTIYTGVIALLAAGFWLIAPDGMVTPVLFYMIAFFYAITLGVYMVVVYASREKFAQFNNKFMLSTVIKLVLYMVIMIAYVFAFPEDAVNFLITFLVLYILFTGFEIIFIIKATKNIKSRE